MIVTQVVNFLLFGIFFLTKKSVTEITFMVIWYDKKHKYE